MWSIPFLSYRALTALQMVTNLGPMILTRLQLFKAKSGVLPERVLVYRGEFRPLLFCLKV
jgi:hypothetical protein